MNPLVMGFECILRIKLTITLWAFDFLQLAGPHCILTITTTYCSNAEFLFRITYQVAVMDHMMWLDCISAYDNLIVFPSVAFTVEKLHLGRHSTTTTCGHVFPQDMATHYNIP